MPKPARIEIKVITPGMKRKRHKKLTVYQHFVQEYVRRTGGDFKSAGAAWKVVKQQAAKKGVSVNDVNINFS